MIGKSTFAFMYMYIRMFVTMLCVIHTVAVSGSQLFEIDFPTEQQLLYCTLYNIFGLRLVEAA